MNIKDNINDEPALFAVEENSDIAIIEEKQDLAITSVSATEVADLRAMGLTDAEIAEILGVDEFNDSLITADKSDDNSFDIDTSLDESYILANDETLDTVLDWSDNSEQDNNPAPTERNINSIKGNILFENNLIPQNSIVEDNIILDETDDDNDANIVENDIILDDKIVNENEVVEITNEETIIDDEVVNEEIISDDEIINEETISDDEVINEEIISDDEVINEEIISDDEVINDETVIDDEVVNEEIISDDEVVNEEIISDDEVVNKETIIDDEIINEKTVIDDEVINEEIIIDDEIISDDGEENYDINDLKQMGFTDEEICAILNIDSLEPTPEVNAITEIDIIEEETTTETEEENEEFTNILPLTEEIFENTENIEEQVIIEEQAIEVIADKEITEDEVINEEKSDNLVEEAQEIEEEIAEATETIINKPKLDINTTPVAKDKNAVTARLLPYAENQFLTMPTHTLLELIELPQIIALPASEKFVYGLLAWQGKLIPVIDLAVFINPELDKADNQIDFVLIVAYQQANGMAHIAIKLDNSPTSVFVNNDMMCQLPTSSVINWQYYAISCFEYDNNPVPIVNPDMLFQDYD